MKSGPGARVGKLVDGFYKCRARPCPRTMSRLVISKIFFSFPFRRRHFSFLTPKKFSVRFLAVITTLPIHKGTMSQFYRITQLRSTIGMPPQVRKNIQALGLRKRNQVIYHKVSPSIAHTLAKVKELVKIDLVNEYKTATQINQERKFKPGFQIEKGSFLKSSYE